jgi:hypothetical protein
MRLSSLVSALYDLSEGYKEEIKNAGGAKSWLSIHSEEFILDADCAPGHESVTLRTPLPRPPTVSGSPMSLHAADGRSPPTSPHGHDCRSTMSDDDAEREAAHRQAHQHGSSLRVPALLVPNNGTRDKVLSRLRDGGGGGDSPPRSLHVDDLPESQSCSLSGLGRADTDDADAAAAAALLGAASECSDPLLIEKKIRAVQKKLRRVQTIEQLAGSDGCTLDSGQQVLLASKPRLQALLSQLLQQWAVLEPALLEQQQLKMAAIADSECAICLEEYSPNTPGIRTSCCGYHFHHSCLSNCLETTGHCPICSAPKASCKVVQQRRAGAPASAVGGNVRAGGGSS